MIGALVNVYRGRKINNGLKKRLAQTEQRLNGLDSHQELIAQIDEPYDRVIAKNQFQLVEYYQKREQNLALTELKTLWEMVKEEMAANIQETEQQLQEMSATKLDIIRILASLSQLSNEFDLELEALRQASPNVDTEAIVSTLQNHPLIQQLQSNMNMQSRRLGHFKTEVEDFIKQYEVLKEQFENGINRSNAEFKNANTKLAEIKSSQMGMRIASNLMKEDISRLQKSEQQLKEEMASLKEKVADHNTLLNGALEQIGLLETRQQQRLLQFEERTKKALSEMQQTFFKKTDGLVQQLKVANEAITLLEQNVDMRLQTIQQQLDAQKAEWSARADLIDRTIFSHANAQRKSLMQWTLPLYGLVIGIIAVFFIF